MKILYGVQTTGNGHIVRSREMIEALRGRGHDVHTVLSGGKDKTLFNQAFFEPSAVFQGLSFVVRKGRLCYFQTARRLNIPRFYKDIVSFKAKDFDLVITDYEPITARIARRNKIPSIGIGHLYAFAHSVPVPGSRPFALQVMNRFAPVDYPLGLHWHHFNQSILPPTIPSAVRSNAAKAIQDKILVYLPFEDRRDIRETLAPLTRSEFFIYADIDTSVDENHLQWRPFSRAGFLRDLRESSGVICNGGFSLISEALHLGKKVLAKPVEGQIEQEANVQALLELDLGHVMRRLDTTSILKWSRLAPGRPQNYPDVISKVAEWIDSRSFEDRQALVRSVWKDTR